MSSFCYWSVADNEHGLMIQSTIQSARNVNIKEDFHIWTNIPINGAITHNCENYNKNNYLFKFNFLKNEVSKLDYDYFVFLDADTFFVRHPGNILHLLYGSPIHVCLESDCTLENNIRPDWWGCPLKIYVKLMREKGVRSKAIFNTNAGFWIVKKDVINTFYTLAMDFWEYSKNKEYIFTEEAPLAYCGHMLTGNPYLHTLNKNKAIWASDWTGWYKNRLPDGSGFKFEDYMSGKKFIVNPAIIHCMRSKDILIKRKFNENN